MMPPGKSIVAISRITNERSELESGGTAGCIRLV